MDWPGFTVSELLKFIDGANGRICQKILSHNRTLFKKVQGSTNNHQAWRGGYLDHVTETMNWGFVLYRLVSEIRDLPFSLSDALLVLYLHDIEKPWKYKLGLGGQLQHKPELRTKEAQHAFRDQKLADYGIVLSVEQQNALKYAEGELADYTNLRRVMNELAGFCHICDVMSARVFHNYPRMGVANVRCASRVAEAR
jgi:hypothetical protein